jgi:hypothetical protein
MFSCCTTTRNDELIEMKGEIYMSIVLCSEVSLLISNKMDREILKQLMEEYDDRFRKLRVYRKL